jgi:two-component system, cell cycle sensor histidine kinase and response regulator CckA
MSVASPIGPQDAPGHRRRDLRLRTLFEHGSDAILVLDAGGLRATNRRFREIFALKQAPPPEFDWSQLLEASSRELALGIAEQWKAGRTRFPRSFAVVARRPGGGRIELELRLSLVRWQGRPAALILACDRSEARRLRSQLRQTERLETLGQLAGGLAHDFNNLLAAISGHVELAQLAGNPEAAQQELAAALDVIGRARALTGQLLGFSRRQSREPLRMDLAAAIRERLPLLTGLLGRRCEPRLEVLGEPGRVRLDPTELEQVLLNLAVNARDAMPGGGRLRLRLRALRRERAGGRLHPRLEPGPFVQLLVQDEGCGIPAAVLDRIFDPLFSTKPEGRGTGLGLSTVYGIVRRAGGQIHVMSCPEWGTRFEIEWPRVGADSSSLPLDPPEPAPQRILWIGPEREELADLERAGHWIRRATGELQAEGLLAGLDPPPQRVVRAEEAR